MGVLLRRVEIAGEIVDVRFDRDITEMGALTASADEEVIEGNEGLLLPGLHDHHIHLAATAAASQSVDVAVCVSIAEFEATLRTAAAQALRVVGYHEIYHGELDRWKLDAIEADRPVRVQHGTGKMWVLNSVALARLDARAFPDRGVERDGQGRLTGRFFRLDAWLREQLKTQDADLTSLTQTLASYGVTGVTDASFTNDFAQQTRLQGLHNLSVHVMGDLSVTGGQFKVMLDADRLPLFDELVRQIETAHTAGRGVAFHSVTHAEVVYALSALQAARPHAQDRLEHGSMIDVSHLPLLKELGCVVVTQPGFVRDRGSRYRQAHTPSELVDLYRFQSLIDAGVPTIASSDAPYGPLNPWEIMQAAVDRCDDLGQPLNEAEAVSPEVALQGYLQAPDDLRGDARSLSVGKSASFCLLSSGWQQVRSHLADAQVVGTWAAGVRCFTG